MGKCKLVIAILVLATLLPGCSNISGLKENQINVSEVIDEACRVLRAKYEQLSPTDYFYSARGYSKSLPIFQRAARLDSGYVEVSKAVGVLNEVFYEQVELDISTSKLTDYLRTVEAVCGNL